MEENVDNSMKSRNSPDRISTYSENSIEPNLVIDDGPSSSGSWWPQVQEEPDRHRSESMDSSDPLIVEGDSDNEYYDQQVLKLSKKVQNHFHVSCFGYQWFAVWQAPISQKQPMLCGPSLKVSFKIPISIRF